MHLRTRARGRNATQSGRFLIVAFLVAIAISIGPLAFQYVLEAATGRDIPWYVDLIAGTILSEIVMLVAIVVWVVKLCGVPTPFFG